ncbi:DNA/RNA helicase [Candidatus Wolfebacteria bacterium]|nr:MAG: DNA/RNA helicase [Candidatus Wolfebacteria bacterium]
MNRINKNRQSRSSSRFGGGKQRNSSNGSNSGSNRSKSSGGFRSASKSTGGYRGGSSDTRSRGGSSDTRRSGGNSNDTRNRGGSYTRNRSNADTRGRSSGGYRGGNSGGYRGGNSGGNRGRSNGGNRGGGGGGGGGRRGGRRMPTFDPSQFINTNPVDTKEEVYQAQNTFADFNINRKLLQTITRMGIETPSPIQDKVIPEILEFKDVVGLAETGTGKTAAFLIPIIENTLQDKNRQTLILAPTRELAIQIEEELRKLAKDMQIYSVVCVGGVGIQGQIRSLKRRNQFIIGTPGRILDLINRKAFLPEYVTTVVLDEADRMLEMGFIQDMRDILSKTSPDRETLFFSATMAKETEKLVHDFMKDPVMISVKKKDTTNSIEQDVVRFRQSSKFETLHELLKKRDFSRVIVFGAMKHSVKELASQLAKNGIRSESLHGNKSHFQRQRSLANFKAGKADVLVATDVAARGIHVDDVSHVINYDLPSTFDDYVHRIGRTGRATKKGKALTFIPA